MKFHILKDHQDGPVSHNVLLDAQQIALNTEQQSSKTSIRNIEITTKVQSAALQKHIKLEQQSESDADIVYDTNKEKGNNIINHCQEKMQKEPKCWGNLKGTIGQECIIDDDNVVNDHITTSHMKKDKNITINPLVSKATSVDKCIKISFSPGEEKVPKKSLAESLVAAVTDNDNKKIGDSEKIDNINIEEMTSDDLKLKFNIRKLLDVMVDKPVLEKLGWPHRSEEDVSTFNI